MPYKLYISSLSFVVGMVCCFPCYYTIYQLIDNIHRCMQFKIINRELFNRKRAIKQLETPTKHNWLIIHQTKCKFHWLEVAKPSIITQGSNTVLLFISGVSSSLKIQSIIITSPNPCAVQWHDRRVVWPIMDTILSTTQAHIHIKWIRGFSRIWSNNDILVFVFFSIKNSQGKSYYY